MKITFGIEIEQYISSLSEAERSKYKDLIKDISEQNRPLGKCHCGGDIVIIYGLIPTTPRSDVFGPLLKKMDAPASVGPVCEKCGLCYEPLFFD